MQLVSIGSSSSGNSTLIYNDDTSIIIDCGIPVKHVFEKTGRKNFDALMITHDHSDHTKSAGALARKTKAPVYVSPLITTHDPDLFKNCTLNDIDEISSFKIGSMEIQPFSTKHDAVHSLGFVFKDAKTKFCYLTDTGSVSKVMKEAIKDCNSYFIESDYDEELIDAYEGYDQLLKDRIKSNFGHLSTQQALNLVNDLDINRIKVVILGHLSPRTNSPEKVMERIKERFPNHVEKFVIAPFEGIIEL